MLRGMYTGASGMMVDQRRLDVIANNLANASTIGYKRDTSIRQSFNDFVVVRLNDQDPTTSSNNEVGRLAFGTITAFTATKLTTGNLISTGNPLDVAIDGDGFFAVNTPQGARYTRDGSFRQNADGYLVTKEGYEVLVNGRPVRAEQGELSIRGNGEVYSGDLRLGQLSVVSSAELGSIRKEGAGLWMPIGQGEPTALVTSWESNGIFAVRAGYLESSNVEPVTEMVEMMTTVRSYEMNQKAVQAQDEALQKLVTEVGRV